tara:strand:+ start:516 stop:1373 length:858 start_codon:yes stop_codon:yes gene_type:complete
MKNLYFAHNQKTYFIAEIGINHNGDVNNALKLVEEAKKAGCNAVKFQKRYPRDCVPKKIWNVKRTTPWGEMTYIDYKEKMELKKKDYKKIIKLCRKLKIDWSASCWDTKSVDFMEELNIPYYKVASASLTDINLLKKIKKTKKPVIISTGMSTLNQIKKAVKILGCKNLGILHCNSSYPAKYEELNLNFIPKLKKIFPQSIVGYSGHEKGLSSTVAAAVLGAKIIERHITLDKAMWGTDQLASIEPMGFARIIRDIRIIEVALGEAKKIVFKSEKEVMKKLRIVG